ncbi:MAG TPA: hypothetical protein VF880_00145 [Actinomycetes bacterium]|jgi:hypothetical protein
MSGKHRALAVLALSLTLAAATAAVAVAATPPTGIEDRNDRLLRNLQATQAERAQAAVAQARALERDFAAAAVAAPVEDQNDRLLRSLQAAQAEGTQAAVARARAMERDFVPAPAVDVVAAQPIARPDVTTPAAGVDVLATLLLGLAGGLVGGCAAIGGWAIAARRRVHRVAATV